MKIVKLFPIAALIGVAVLAFASVGGGSAQQHRPADAAFKDDACAAEVCVADVQVVPNDPKYPQQYGPQVIHAPEAWDITTGNPGVIIATVDTGVDCTHEDLAGACVAGGNCVISIPCSPLTGNENSDDHGHGTHVSSIEAGRTNNGIGVAGICWNCSIMPVKVLNSSGSGTWASVAAGIRFATDHGARVINMSLGGSSFDRGVNDAIDYAYSKNVLVVSACGNSGNAVADCSYPAAMTNSMGISCTGSNDAICSFSSAGPQVDVAAPGLSVLAAVPTGTCSLCDPTGYRLLSGTSMSTPHVSGLAGLLASATAWSNNVIWGTIQCTADDLGSAGWDRLYGYGRINAGRATHEQPCFRAPTPPGSTPTPTPTATPSPTPTPIPTCPFPGQHLNPNGKCVGPKR